MNLICHDCGAYEGSLHNRGCFNECCPYCFGQLAFCHCSYLYFGYKPQPTEAQHPTMGLPKDIFINGLSDAQLDEWDGIVTRKGRIPYFHFSNICTRCGEVEPDLFMVSDEEWQSVVPENHWCDVICRTCFDKMNKLFSQNS